MTEMSSHAARRFIKINRMTQTDLIADRFGLSESN